MPTLVYALEMMHAAFKVNITRAKANRLLTSKKDPKESWMEHYLYLIAVNDSVGSCEPQVLENIVYFASPEWKNVLLPRYDPRRLDFLAHAEELAQYHSYWKGQDPATL